MVSATVFLASLLLLLLLLLVLAVTRASAVADVLTAVDARLLLVIQTLLGL